MTTLALVAVPGALPAAADTILTAAGNGSPDSAGDGGQATEAAVAQPHGLFATADGGYVWAEPSANRVRRVGPDGIVTTIAGTGRAGFSGDRGPATRAELNFPQSAAPMSDDGYVIADVRNQRIRRISPDGRITTVAGTGVAGYSGDGGPATAAMINYPLGVAGLPDGGFLIPDSGNHRVRRVWPDGTITTVAGTGVQGFSGDGGRATGASLSLPFGVAPTADGGFLVVDVGNQRIRKVASDGTITTVAGNGVAGYSGDGGPATAASLRDPHNVAALPKGGFFIADTSNQRVRLVSPDGTIMTLAGVGMRGFAGDGGSAAQARLNAPEAVAVLANGAALVADEQNNRIRFIGTPSVPVNVGRPSVRGTPAFGKTLQAHPGGWRGYGVRFAYAWQRCKKSGRSCVLIPGARRESYVVQAADAGRTLRVRVTGSTVARSAVAQSAPTRVRGVATRAFPIVGSAADGYVWRDESGGKVTPVRVTTTSQDVVVERGIYGKGLLVSDGLLRFNTGVVPNGARIVSVRLQLQISYASSEDRLRLVVEPYPPARWPIDPGDFATRPGQAPVGSVDLASLEGAGAADIRLHARTVDPRESFTGLRLLIPGGTTDHTNALYFASFDHRRAAAPVLVVTYSVS